MNLHFLKLLLVLTILAFPGLSRKTLQIITIANHGHTFPKNGKIGKYITNKSTQYKVPENSESKLYDQLTGNGMRMDYLLGKNLGQAYQEFLASEIKRIDDISIVSSPFPANSMSAQNILLGLLGPKFDTRKFFPYRGYSFPPFKGDLPVNKDIETALPANYYPLPVHTTSQVYNDLFMAYSPSVCNWFANLNKNSKQILKKYIDEINQIISQEPILQSLNSELQNKKGILSAHVNSVEEIDDLINYLRSMRYFDQSFRLNMSVYYALTLTHDIISSSFYFDKFGLQIILTPILNHLTMQINKMLLSREQPLDKLTFPKFLLYSGHEIVVWAFLQAFHLSSTSCLEDIYDRKIRDNCSMRPDYASSIVLELFEDDDTGQVMIGECLLFGLTVRRLLQRKVHEQRHRAQHDRHPLLRLQKELL